MAVTPEFESNWLECQDKFGKNIEAGDIEVLAINEIDDAVSLPAVKFSAAYNPTGTNTFQEYRHVPMATFKKAVDDLAEEASQTTQRLATQVSQATSDLDSLKSRTETAAQNANAAASNASAAIVGAEKVDAELEGMTVTITNRNGTSKSVKINFDFYKTYASVAAMNADAANIPLCGLVSIATDDPLDEDNALVYQKRSDGTMHKIADLDQASSEAWADWLDNKKPAIEAAIDQAAIDHTQAVSDHSTASSDHTTATGDHTQAGQDHQQYATDHQTFTTNEQQRQSTFSSNEQTRQSTFSTNEAQRQQTFEENEADRMAAMSTTRCFVDFTTMCLMFVQTASDTTEYKVRNGNLYIKVTYDD